MAPCNYSPEHPVLHLADYKPGILLRKSSNWFTNITHLFASCGKVATDTIISMGRWGSWNKSSGSPPQALSRIGSGSYSYQWVYMFIWKQSIPSLFFLLLSCQWLSITVSGSQIICTFKIILGWFNHLGKLYSVYVVFTYINIENKGGRSLRRPGMCSKTKAANYIM